MLHQSLLVASQEQNKLQQSFDCCVVWPMYEFVASHKEQNELELFIENLHSRIVTWNNRGPNLKWPRFSFFLWVPKMHSYRAPMLLKPTMKLEHILEPHLQVMFHTLWAKQHKSALLLELSFWNVPHNESSAMKALMKPLQRKRSSDWKLALLRR